MKVRHLMLLSMILAISMFVCGLSAQETEGRSTSDTSGLKYIGAALSVGLSCIGASYAVAKSGTAAMGALTEKPELFGKIIAIVGLAEGIAIYGLLIAILIVI